MSTLSNKKAPPNERIAAAGLAGDPTVINDATARTLLSVIGDASEPEDLRARAAISLGPSLELADIDGFDDPMGLDTVPITEPMFDEIQETLHHLYLDTGTPKEVLRRILEASVRAPEPWHEDAIRTAYASGDRDWMLTAVFAMRFMAGLDLQGFDDDIVQALQSSDPEIHLEAVRAAGPWQLDQAWPHVVSLIEDRHTPKDLLLAAIDALAEIRPAQSREILEELAGSADEEIAEAVQDAMSMAGAVEEMEDD